MNKPVGLDGVQVKFDDERVVSDAGIQRRSGSGERLAWGIVSDLDLMRALCEG